MRDLPVRALMMDSLTGIFILYFFVSPLLLIPVSNLGRCFKVEEK